MTEEEKKEKRKNERDYWDNGSYTISESLCDEVMLREHWLGINSY